MSLFQTTPSDSQPSATADRILDVAQALIQRQGYNAVSYNDLAAELDLSTAAIHYHYSSKADLGQALVARYRRTNAQVRADIQSQTDDLSERLELYVDLHGKVLDGGGLCLCGVLASDETTLPKDVRREVRQFFEEQENWLTHIIQEESPEGNGLRGYETPRQAAEVFLAAVEGALFTSRAQGKGTGAYEEALGGLIETIVA